MALKMQLTISVQEDNEVRI